MRRIPRVPEKIFGFIVREGGLGERTIDGAVEKEGMKGRKGRLRRSEKKERSKDVGRKRGVGGEK